MKDYEGKTRIWKFPESERTVEEYLVRHNEWLIEYYGEGKVPNHREEQLDKFYAEHEVIVKEFPCVITLETDHYSLDDIDDILRSFLGHEHGECHWRKCRDANLNYKMIREIAEHMKKEYNDSVGQILEDIRCCWGDFTLKHSHKGQWNSRYILKTGYDFGFMNYYFKDPAHIERMRVACTLDENYMIL